MNLLRRLSRLQRRVLGGIVAGKYLFVPSLGYECICPGKDLGLRPGEKHYAWRHELKAIKSLEQRRLVRPDRRGILVGSPEAVRAFRRAHA